MKISEMQVYELMEEHMEKIFKENPEWLYNSNCANWLIDNHIEWMVDNHIDCLLRNCSDWLCQYRTEYMIKNHPEYLSESYVIIKDNKEWNEWLAEHKPVRLCLSNPGWVLENCPELMKCLDVPQDILDILNKNK